MGLNNLHLTPSLLTALYPASLVSLDTEIVRPAEQVASPEVTEETEAPALKYLGNNQKNILVVVNYDDAVHLPDADLGFLTNMLTACKLSLGDVAIVNKKNYPGESYKEILAYFKSKTVFLFGVDPVGFGMPVNFPFYQVQAVGNCTFLYTPPLEEQQNDPLLKSKLWVCLRNIFRF